MSQGALVVLQNSPEVFVFSFILRSVAQVYQLACLTMMNIRHFGVLPIFFNGFEQVKSNGLNQHNNMKSNFLESADHLKDKFSLKLKTVVVTRSYAHDFEKKYLKMAAYSSSRESLIVVNTS